MIDISRKILSSFTLVAIIVISAGFSDGMFANAKADSMSDGMWSSAQTIQTMQSTESDSIMHDSVPDGNDLKPCCQDKQGSASVIQATTLKQDVKISLVIFSEYILDNNSVFKYKLTELSSASPPPPDVLSSILKKE